MTNETPAKRAIRKRPVAPDRGTVDATLRALRADVWARDLRLHVDGKLFTTKGREYVIPVMRDMHPHIVIPKAAQTAFTISMLVGALHRIAERRWNHLYLLPLKTGAIPFVQGRLDPIIDSSPKLRELFHRVENRMHKQTIFNTNLYIRGTNIETELREIPVDREVWDERDKMVEENLTEALARMDGSKIKHLVELSTPTAPGHGVDSEDAWYNSDMHRWHVPCPHCGRFQVINFLENVKLGDVLIECKLECQHCHKEISNDERWAANADGRWEPTNLNGDLRGYHISQFNSPTQELFDILENYYLGQRNSKRMRAFYNNNLGQPFVALGDQFTPELLDSCVKKGHRLGGIPNGVVYMGVDVGGANIHVKASTLTRHGHRQAWGFWIFQEWGQLDKLLQSLISFVAVIDAHPEKRAARDLALKYPAKVYLGFEKDRPEQSEIANFSTVRHGEAGKCSIDRTLAFDGVINSYMRGEVILPADAREIGEKVGKFPYGGFYHQMIQQVRTEEEDTNGRIVARWRKNKNPDHWHHADMFEWVASHKGSILVIPPDISRAFANAGGFHGTRG
jgi:Phage terminase large subunit (GpA)